MSPNLFIQDIVLIVKLSIKIPSVITIADFKNTIYSYGTKFKKGNKLHLFTKVEKKSKGVVIFQNKK